MNAASDSPPPGLANVPFFLVLLSTAALVSVGLAVRPSGSPLLLTYDVKAPPSRLLGRTVRVKGGGTLGMDLVEGLGVGHMLSSLSEWEKSLSTEARDSRLLEESMVRLFGASWVSERDRG